MAVLEKVSYFVGEDYSFQASAKRPGTYGLIPVAFTHLGFTLSAYRYNLPERHIEGHHDGETDHEGEGRDIGAAAFRLGDELFGHDEDHGYGGEGQCVGQDGLGDEHGRRTDDGRDGLNDTRELPIEEAASPAHPLAPQGYGDSRALREILQPDADGQRDRRPQRSPGNTLRDAYTNRPEGDPHGQTLRDVVQRYGGHQEHTAPPAGVDTLGFG